jgi:nicotinamidase-related amidase
MYKLNELSQNTALLIIDMINDFQFEYGPLLAQKAATITPNILKLKKAMKEQAMPVIYVNDYYNIRQADIKKLISHCRNDLNQKIITHLYPQQDDYFIFKPKHSAFYGTSLDDLLNQLHIANLMITGIAGNICVLFTANDAYMRNYQLIIPGDCIASNNDHDHVYALKMMENVLKANTACTENLFSKYS